MTRLALLERLKAVQQTPKFERRDITTIAAILNTKALARHVEVCETDAGITRPADDAPSGPA
ncbi:hypothetical protein [Shinella sumterensis]|jgi:hypothetical protein|uniref:Uncharacterized protein n=1 Tax=Shinella sumterensis TaxID=1967501 RepID=A0AA50DG72_9HYPH|nr:hypothetical protein [Shinella sumterensis]MDP9588382.1 hypothetical protein [Shinella zoogloeoides]MCD1262761.1 hypothetical protein [Shinella sumterensis]TFE98880.1 hypothetical protein B5M44_08335 [Shinella sumterensis]WLS00468.1 hypothetical protein Q9313_20620 [Shinella sumterensis]WLS11477.1 hypothetical protein Q9314_21965 [Shinella sumterensis]